VVGGRRSAVGESTLDEEWMALEALSAASLAELSQSRPANSV